MTSARADIAVLVPKADEYSALVQAFGWGALQTHGKIGIQGAFKIALYTTHNGGEYRIVVVLMNGQNNDNSAAFTKAVRAKFAPKLLILFGSALGRKGAIRVGDTVFSQAVWPVAESKGNRIRPGNAAHVPYEVMTDIENYEGLLKAEPLWFDQIRARLAIQGVDMGSMDSQPSMQAKRIVSSNELIEIESAEDSRLTNYWFDQRTLCYEMESAGFARACGKMHWLVVRGISDYGDQESRSRRQLRIPAVFCAAVALRDFIERGIAECDPLRKGKQLKDPRGVSVKPIRVENLSLSARISRDERIGGVGLVQLAKEAEKDSLDASPDQILIYGPPGVGKTCRAVKQALVWMRLDNNSPRAYLINPSHGHSPDVLNQLLTDVSSAAPVLVIVDDLHFAGSRVDEWIEAVSLLRLKRTGPTRVVWISRDSLSQLSGIPRLSFSLGYSIDTFRHLTSDLGTRMRVPALLELGLDLPTLKSSTLRIDSHIEFDSILERIDGVAKQANREWLEGLEDSVGKDAYELYLRMLPFWALGYAVPISALRDIGGPSSDLPLRKLRESGLISSLHEVISLTEHPLQVSKRLDALQHMAVASLAADWWKEAGISSTRKPSLAECVFSRYLLTGNATLALRRLAVLANHAEWSGARGHLASALQFMLNCVPEATAKIPRDVLTELARKLTRSRYPGDELEFTRVLNESQSDWQRALTAAMSNTVSGKAGNFRLDTIHYEIGYLHFMQAQYADAQAHFRKSIDSALDLISRAIAGHASVPDAQMALAHVWIAAILEKSVEMRRSIAELLERSDRHGTAEQRLGKLVTDIAQIHNRLREANEAPEAASASPYLEALRVISPDWKPPGDKPLSRTPRMNGPLARHQQNAWLHAVEMACWPRLFGVSHDAIELGVPSPDGRYAPEAVFTPAISVPVYRKQHIELLWKWATTSVDHAELGWHAIAVASLRKAGGEFEYLSELLLVAWHSLGEETREAVSWFIQSRIPKVGFNELSRLFLQRHKKQPEL